MFTCRYGKAGMLSSHAMKCYDIYEPVRTLCSYRCDTNLRDSLVRSHLNTISVSDEDRGTFPCGRSRCNTCTHTNASPTINTPGGCITITSRYTCIIYVVPATRSTSENTYVLHDKPTPIFPFVDTSHHQAMPVPICWCP